MAFRWYCNGVKFYIIQEPLLNIGTFVITLVKKAIRQTFKLAVFRTYFGLKMFKFLNFHWWIKTFDTYYYLASLSLKWFLRRLINSN